MAQVEATERIINWRALKRRLGRSVINGLIASPSIVVGVICVAIAAPQVRENSPSAWFPLSLGGFYALLAYYIPRTNSNQGSGVLKFLISLVVAVLGYIILPFGLESGGPQLNTIRISNAKQMATAHLIYLADYNEARPPPSVWRDALQPYLKNNELEGNERIGWLTLNAFQSSMTPNQTAASVLFYYSTQNGPNPIGAGADPIWIKEKEVVAFGDSHVKSVKKEEFGALPWRSDQGEVKP